MGQNLSDLFLYVCKSDEDTKIQGVIKYFIEKMYPEVRCPMIFKAILAILDPFFRIFLAFTQFSWVFYPKYYTYSESLCQMLQ